jgi:exopolysaccharide biosynthesis polyprenyl glycosylphosphotransferase
LKNIKRQILFDIYKLTDLLLLTVSFLIAVQANFKDPLEQIELRLKPFNALLGAVLLIVGHYTFKSFGAYDSKRFSSLIQEIYSAFKAVFFNALLLASISAFIKSALITPNSVLTYFVISLVFLTLSRCSLFIIMKVARIFGRNIRRVIIVGTNEKAIQLGARLPTLGYNVDGYIDSHWHYYPQPKKPLIRDYEKFIRDNPVDEILICIPIKNQYQLIEQVIALAEEQGIIVRMYTDLFDLKIAKAKIEHFEGDPLLTLYTGNMYRRMVVIKEIIDTIISSILFIVSLPIFIATAIAIKVTSPGPIFFKQERLGINKGLFKVFKFRTMVIDAEDKLKDIEHLNERKGEATFKIKKDPRVTPLGYILRMFSIDELPQLLNVIKGDMSLVGPRPLPVRDYKGFDKNWQRRRFSVKPGITCIWQISGRDNIKFEDWMRMDNEYIDTWSLWLDLKILIKTLPAVLLSRGAS